MYRNNFEGSRKRAEIARKHGCRHTFIEPETLLHLIAVHRDILKLRRLIERHYAVAEKEKRPYNEHDTWLWAQGLGWYE